MKVFLIIFLTALSIPCQAQFGYVKLFGKSAREGFLRSYKSLDDGQPGIELWLTKQDKNRVKYPLANIEEYAIKKDTFKILHQFSPFEESKTYFEVAEARRKVSGKINLYIIDNYANANRVSTYTGGGLIPFIIDESMGNHTFMYILEERETGHLKALPAKKEELLTVLAEFLPEEHIASFKESNGNIRYRAIPDIVTAYNLKGKETTDERN